MNRSLRIYSPGLIYHVINRGNNRQVIFLEDEDFERYLGVIYRFKKVYEFKLYAYCLMTNHVHLLIKVGAKGSISKIMQSITLAEDKLRKLERSMSGDSHYMSEKFSQQIAQMLPQKRKRGRPRKINS